MHARMVPLLAILLLAGAPTRAQQLDLSHGGPIEITARDGLDWHQNEQMVIAHGDARAVRGDVTVLADRLLAHYRHKASAPTQAASGQAAPVQKAAATAGTPGAADETGGSEIYRLEAIGNVRIYTATDRATADHAIYDIDQSVLVLTGNNLRLNTPNQLITARDSLEYWANRHMAVARGAAVITTADARQLSADTVVAYMTNDADKNGEKSAVKPALTKPAAGSTSDEMAQQSGKLDRAEAFGNVVIRTPTQTVRGDRGVYLPPTGLARLAGNAHLTQGANQVNGADLEVDLNTGIYRLLAAPGERVQGLVVPNDTTAPGTPVTGPGKP